MYLRLNKLELKLLITKVVFWTAGLLVMLSCNNDDDSPSPRASGEKEIIEFTFLASENNALQEDIKTTIDKDQHTITTTVAFGTDVTALKPEITISEKASITPENETPVNFTNVVTYKVTAEDGSTQDYVVTVNIAKSSDKVIKRFIFLVSDNNTLNEDFEADIDEDNKMIKVKLPHRVDLTSLIPTVEVSPGAAVLPKGKEATDFSNPVDYTVTAADGSSQKYTVTVTKSRSARDVLIAIDNANPGNRLGWDQNESDLSKWFGITLTNNAVTKIDIEGDNLDVLPPEIGDLLELDTLRIRSNGLTDLPAEIGELRGLKELNLTANRIKTLPEEMGNLTELVILYVGRNELKELPQSLGSLQNLKILSIALNEFIDFPESITKLNNLEELYADENELGVIPETIGALKNLKHLRLTENKLGSLPQAIGQLASLEELYAARMDISDLPAEISMLTNLKDLRLCNNAFESFPKVILSLPNLEILELRNNNISTLPDEITNLKSLKYLDIGFCGLRSLPKTIEGLENLEVLFLTSNILNSLLPEIGNLSNLKELRAPFTRLRALPEALGKLKKLEILDVSSNQITSLPPELGNLDNLKTLNVVFNNELITFPEPLCELIDRNDVQVFGGNLNSLCK